MYNLWKLRHSHFFKIYTCLKNNPKGHDGVPYAKDYDFLNFEYPRLKRGAELRKLQLRKVKWQGLNSWPAEKCRSPVMQIFLLYHTPLPWEAIKDIFKMATSVLEFLCFVFRSTIPLVNCFMTFDYEK